MSETTSSTQSTGASIMVKHSWHLLNPLDDYKRFYPIEGSTAHGDTLLAETGTCPDCAGPLSYEGFKRLFPWSYRAFTVCRACEWFQEF